MASRAPGRAAPGTWRLKASQGTHSLKASVGLGFDDSFGTTLVASTNPPDVSFPLPLPDMGHAGDSHLSRLTHSPPSCSHEPSGLRPRTDSCQKLSRTSCAHFIIPLSAPSQGLLRLLPAHLSRASDARHGSSDPGGRCRRLGGVASDSSGTRPLLPLQPVGGDNHFQCAFLGPVDIHPRPPC